MDKVCKDPDCESNGCPKPISDFYRNKDSTDGHLNRCKKCCQRLRKLTYRAKGYGTSSQKRWYDENKTHVRYTIVKRRYGITKEQVEEILDNQKHCCAICGTDKPGHNFQNWCVDHDHTTKEVRGFLCGTCNISLGIFEKCFNNPNVREYLENPPARLVLKKELS